MSHNHMTASGFLHVDAESKAPYPADVLAALTDDAVVIIARYPQKQSALLPLLHLVQSVDGYVTGRGIDFCAGLLDLTEAEVSGVATFYTQYKRHPNGEYTVGVCTNTLCAVMGGDQIFERVADHLGVAHDETTADGKVTLERIECNAACDYAPVVMANWEFFDNQTPESTMALVDDLRAGVPVRPTRGADTVASFKQVSRVLAGFNDGRGGEGVGAGPASLLGLRIAKDRDWVAPGERHRDGSVAGESEAEAATDTTADTTSPVRTPQPADTHTPADTSTTPDAAPAAAPDGAPAGAEDAGPTASEPADPTGESVTAADQADETDQADEADAATVRRSTLRPAPLPGLDDSSDDRHDDRHDPGHGGADGKDSPR